MVCCTALRSITAFLTVITAGGVLFGRISDKVILSLPDLMHPVERKRNSVIKMPEAFAFIIQINDSLNK
jgi:hypothetical protein